MGKNRKWVWLLLAIAVFLLGFASFSWAEFSITPSIALREEYNDNIFLTRTNKEYDFITSISPAVSLKYTPKSDLLTLSLDYGFDIRLYARHSDQNLTSPTNTQTAKLDTTVPLYKDILQLKVFDQYSRVPIDVRKPVSINNYIVNMTDSNLLLANPYMLYPLTGTLKYKLSYAYTNQWYNNSSLDKYQSHTFETGFIKDLSSLITASVTYDYIIEQGTTFQDYTRQNVIAGASYQVTPRWSLNGSFGETWLDFQHLGSRARPIWDVSTKYDLTGKLSLTGEFSDNYVDSIDAGVYRRQAATAGALFNGKIPVSLIFSYEKDNYAEIVREDKWKGVAATASVPLTKKITGKLTAIYTDYTFLPENEKVKRYGIDAAVDYTIKITTITFGYTYNVNNSNIDQNDYRNNIIYIQARFAI
jgi:hypothetical protein